jgi:hypothetical protein
MEVASVGGLFHFKPSEQCLLLALRVIRRDAPFLVAIGYTADKRSRQP